MKNISASSKLPIEILTKGNKPMKIEKKQFQYREDLILLAQCTRWNLLQTVRILKQDSRSRVSETNSLVQL